MLKILSTLNFGIEVFSSHAKQSLKFYHSFPPKIASSNCLISGVDASILQSYFGSNTANCQLLSTGVHTVIDAIKLRSDGICWNCKKSLGPSLVFFCGNCQSVLPVHTSNDHFSLFEFKQDFKISVSELQKRFKSLQRQLHPDKFSLKDPFEVAISETVSSQLNKAYSILTKPLSRGLYMLELKGLTLEENDSSDDPEFLMEIMELNENVAELESDDELRVIFDDLTERVADLTVEISDAFQKDDAATAKALLIKFKYFDNLLNQLKERLPPR